MVSGLVVTPILLDAIGTEAFGIWAFIGAITIYLAVLDLGLGPSVVRFTAEARGRRDPEETNAIASVALVLYAAIGVAHARRGRGARVARADPDRDARRPRLGRAGRHVPRRRSRSPSASRSGSSTTCSAASSASTSRTSATSSRRCSTRSLVAFLIPRGGGLVLLGALTVVVDTCCRLGLPLFWLRRELPELALRREYVTRERARELVGVSWSNFLVHVANKVVFSTDVVVVGIVLGAREAAYYAIASRLFFLAFGLASVVTSLLYPAFAEYEGSGEQERQRRLLLSGLRGGSAAALVLALPLLAIPANLIHAWVGDGFSESAPVLALLAVVLLIHQPVWMLTQYLIARGGQREIARLLIAGAAANVALSVVLALTVGTWGVALATLVADAAVLAIAVPLSVAPSAGLEWVSLHARCCGRCCRRSPRQCSSSASPAASMPTRSSSFSRSGSPGSCSPAERSGGSG